MPLLLYKLNGIPEDEVIEVRRLLDENDINYYETDAGRFGISLAAIWLPDGVDPEPATDLLDTYKQQRSQQARDLYQQQQRDGTAETFLQKALHSPIRTVVYIAAILTVLYFSIMPFFYGL
ncbi:MAG: DUF6164 family protein [Gammaproteobacteria bacterium]|nr:DUF6164 family protein [Gammaproteobacteria bacterium]